jgi:hypothetical protein
MLELANHHRKRLQIDITQIYRPTRPMHGRHQHLPLIGKPNAFRSNRTSWLRPDAFNTTTTVSSIPRFGDVHFIRGLPD